MKKYNVKLLIVFFMVSSISCKKSFLDTVPPTSVSSAVFWKTDADVQSALTGVYSRLNENFLGYERVYIDGFSDNAYILSSSNQGSIQSVVTSGFTPGMGGVLNNLYSTPYKLIASANYFIANVDKAPISDAAKNLDIAEVRFLRAFAYFDLVQNFGDVVIYTVPPVTLEAAKIKQSPKEDVYKLIEQDLDFAIANLPDTKYNGHAVKGSAQALKGKVLLTEQKWSDAATILNQIIQGHPGKFDLSNDYAGLFTTEGQAKPTVNIEIMFSTQYLAPLKIQKSAQGMDLELGYYALVQPYADLANDYEYKGTPDINNPYANRDPRLDLTMKLPGEKWLDPTGKEFVPVGQNGVVTGFMTEKYVDLPRLPFATSSGDKTDQDFVHLRYADVLLMYAEAQNEASGPSVSVYAAINAVRARPGIAMPPVDEAIYNSKDLLRTYIRHERRIELAMEGQRYNDIKRWRVADVKLPTMKDPSGKPFIFTANSYNIPFPQSEIDNNPQLDQKPGYTK